MAASGPARADSSSTGRSGAREWARSSPTSRSPSRPGIITSLITRSKGCARTASSASCPSATAVTW